MHKWILLFVFFSATIQVWANPKQQYKTVTGAIFTYEPNAPTAMQPAYRDEKGLLWGDVGEKPAFDHSDAESICNAIEYNGKKARLPKEEEFIRLRESMSRKPNPNSLEELQKNGVTSNSSYYLKKPALPNLGIQIWLHSYTAIAGGGGFVFDSGFGDIAPDKYGIAYSHRVRCVLEP